MDMNHHHHHKIPNTATWGSVDRHITMDQTHDDHHNHDHGHHVLHFNNNNHHQQQQQLDSIWHSYTLQTHELPPLPSSSNHQHHQHKIPEIVSFVGANNNNMNNNNNMSTSDLIGEDDDPEQEVEELGAMKEMMYKIASMQPVDIDPSTIRKPKRRNVRISDDPQSVAARHRRERISEKIRILQRLVPGGTKMDTASMLDEAIRYVKYLKQQIRLLQSTTTTNNNHHQQQSSCTNAEWSWPSTLLTHKPISTQSTDFTLPGASTGSVAEILCFNHEVNND